MDEKLQLVVTSWLKGVPLGYKCSLCGHMFLLPEDRSPKEGVAELCLRPLRIMSEKSISRNILRRKRLGDR